MLVVWCKGISEMFGDVWDMAVAKMDVKKCIWNDGCTFMVGAFEKKKLKKHWLKMGKEMHSNIKYLCGWGAVGIAWGRFIYLVINQGESITLF